MSFTAISPQGNVIPGQRGSFFNSSSSFIPQTAVNFQNQVLPGQRSETRSNFGMNTSNRNTGGSLGNRNTGGSLGFGMPVTPITVVDRENKVLPGQRSNSSPALRQNNAAYDPVTAVNHQGNVILGQRNDQVPLRFNEPSPLQGRVQPPITVVHTTTTIPVFGSPPQVVLPQAGIQQRNASVTNGTGTADNSGWAGLIALITVIGVIILFSATLMLV